MFEPPIRRRSGWGEMFFPEEKAFPHIRSGFPRETSRRRFEWEAAEQGSGRSFRREAETEQSGLCDAAHGGKCFFGAFNRILNKLASRKTCGLFCAKNRPDKSFGRFLLKTYSVNSITERCRQRSCSKPARPSWWRSRTRCRTRRRPSRSCRSERCRRRRRRWRCGNRR